MRKFILIKKPVEGSIASTTTYEGNRNPYLSGIFLSQILTSQGEHRHKSIGFAVRLISRNKVGYIRTNKASHSYVAVETVSHPMDDTFLLTKSYEKNQMKTHQKHTALCALHSSIVSTVTAREVVYA
ncbi:hypothetical protein ACE4RU_11190 [Actinobacillus seminis]|uniref:hypothetical protein n=1 Tax=Actinobacillus seminis TaxID=722 RepID=UPI003B95C081